MGEVLKDEVSYGALIYNAILDCLRESKGSSGRLGLYNVVSYGGYVQAVKNLMALVEVIADDEYFKVFNEIEDEKSEWLESMEKKHRFRWGNDAEARFFNERESGLKYYYFEHFRNVLHLLKRKGVIVERLLKGVKI